MQIEKELWGELSSQEFQLKLAEFSQKIRPATIQKRIAFEFNNYNSPLIDTRLKITNGFCEIVQKVGKFDSEGRLEYSYAISNNPNEIVQLIKILSRLSDSKSSSQYIFQYTNYLFATKDYEIKLAHQTGKIDKYVFEIEQKSERCKLYDTANELKLNYKNFSSIDDEFWQNWNSELNIELASLSDEELLELIKMYTNLKEK